MPVPAKMSNNSLMMQPLVPRLAVSAPGFCPVKPQVSSVQSLSHVRLCNSMDCSTPGFSVQQQLPELTQTHVH